MYSSCLFSDSSLYQIFPLELLLNKRGGFCVLIIYAIFGLVTFVSAGIYFLLNSSINCLYIFCFTMHLFYTFDKLVHIDLVIPILINFLYHFLKLSLDLTINLTAKHHPDLLSTNLTIFIAIKQIKSLTKSILLLLFLLLQPKSNKLTKL